MARRDAGGRWAGRSNGRKEGDRGGGGPRGRGMLGKAMNTCGHDLWDRELLAPVGAVATSCNVNYGCWIRFGNLVCP